MSKSIKILTNSIDRISSREFDQRVPIPKNLEIKDLAGDNNHYSAKISSKMFNGKSKVEQHKLVYKSLKGKMGNELHALSITTEENKL